MAGRRGIDVLLLVTGEVLEVLLWLCMSIWGWTIHGVHPTEAALIVMITIPILNIHSSDAPEIGNGRRVTRERGEVILGHREGWGGVGMI